MEVVDYTEPALSEGVDSGVTDRAFAPNPLLDEVVGEKTPWQIAQDQEATAAARTTDAAEAVLDTPEDDEGVVADEPRRPVIVPNPAGVFAAQLATSPVLSEHKGGDWSPEPASGSVQGGEEGVDGSPRAPTPGGPGQPPRPPGGDVLPAGGEEGDGDDGDAADSEGGAEEASTVPLAERAAGFDRLLDATLKQHKRLENFRPTFIVVPPAETSHQPDVVVFRDRLSLGQAAERPDVPPSRLAFSVTDPEATVPVADLPDDSPWLDEPWAIDGEATAHQLSPQHIVRELAEHAPESEAIALQEPLLADTFQRPETPDVRQIAPMMSGRLSETVGVEILGRASLRHTGARVDRDLLDVRLEGPCGEIVRTSLIEQPHDPHVVATWTGLHQADVPVAPALYVQGEEKILLTDLRAQGAELYGPELERTLVMGRSRPEFGVRRLRLRPEADRQFLRVIDEDSAAIWERARRYALRASHGGVQLSPSSPFELHVDPEGNWDLVAANLQEARVEPNVAFEQRHRENTAALVRLHGSLNNISLRLKSAWWDNV